MARYSIYPFASNVLVDPDQPNGLKEELIFKQLESIGLNPGATITSRTPGGSVDVGCSYMAKAKPMLPVSTRDLLTFFEQISVSGVQCFTNGQMFAQKRAGCQDAFATSTSHERWEIDSGVIVPRSVTASNDDTEGALLNFEVIALSSDGESPIEHETDVDLESSLYVDIVPACVSQYFYGPATIGGVQIPNLERTTIDFGINYQTKCFNGSPYPTEGAIMARNPSFSFTTSDASVDYAVNVFLRAASGVIKQYFQAGVPGSDRLPATNAAHLSITADAGTITTEDISFQGNEDGTTTIRIIPEGALSVSTQAQIVT